MPGTTRHLETVLVDHRQRHGLGPDMPLWAGFPNNEIPTELGKLLTGQDYGGDAKKCMDAVAGHDRLQETRTLDCWHRPQDLDGEAVPRLRPFFCDCLTYILRDKI